MQLFKGVTVGSNGIQISHLQFADDTLIFCEAKEQYLLRIKEVLLSFQSFSGLVVNYHKFGLIVLGKDEGWSQNVATQLDCTILQLPMTYLGIPLGANMRKVVSWQCIIDKIQKKLTSWKSCCLSRASRLVLIKLVFNCLPIYYLSLFKLPKKVASEIIRIQRKFLWSDNKEGKFLPLVKWEIVQQHKDRGGLGVGDIIVKNAALLFKWWWRYGNEEDPLWKKVVQSIHKKSDTIIPSLSKPRPSGQSIWQAIKNMVQEQQQVSKVFLHNLKLEVGNGAKVRFWEDTWTPNGPLMLLFSSLYSLSKPTVCIDF